MDTGLQIRRGRHERLSDFSSSRNRDWCKTETNRSIQKRHCDRIVQGKASNPDSETLLFPNSAWDRLQLAQLEGAGRWTASFLAIAKPQKPKKNPRGKPKCQKRRHEDCHRE